jgi:hypothetical protein
MRGSRLRRASADAKRDRLHDDLKAERKRRQWAEQLAETALNVGEENLNHAYHGENLLRDLLERVEAHQRAAVKADAVRSGDLRLYKHASRIRAGLEEALEQERAAAAELDGDGEPMIDAPVRRRPIYRSGSSKTNGGSRALVAPGTSRAEDASEEQEPIDSGRPGPNRQPRWY